MSGMLGTGGSASIDSHGLGAVMERLEILESKAASQAVRFVRCDEI